MKLLTICVKLHHERKFATSCTKMTILLSIVLRYTFFYNFFLILVDFNIWTSWWKGKGCKYVFRSVFTRLVVCFIWEQSTVEGSNAYNIEYTNAQSHRALVALNWFSPGVPKLFCPREPQQASKSPCLSCCLLQLPSASVAFWFCCLLLQLSSASAVICFSHLP